MSAKQGIPKDASGEFDFPALDVSYVDALPPQLGTDNVQGAIDALKTSAPPPTKFAYNAQTIGAVSANVNTYPFPEDSAGLLKVTVAAVSTFFATGAYFIAEILVRRDGSNDGTVTVYTLTNSVQDATLPGISIQASNNLVGGILEMILNGQAGKTIDWTVFVEPYTATLGQ